ncbi:MAG TPA: hypothetical protein VFV38_18735, partial [Ktedonobacteraceae bacterium]|nr:hypothetical protein [Ktedonobacteraceae bacterium]
PSLSIKWMQKERRVFTLLWEGESRTTLVIERRGEQIGVAVKGTRPLWSELAQAYQEWLELGQPGYEQYGWVMTAQGQVMQVAGMGMTREMALAGV